MPSNLSLLYIEDETHIRKNAIEYFSRMFKNVYEASHGLEGYKMYEKYKPDIIITDIKMPTMNGLELARKIRRIDKKTPIIVLSAYTDTSLLLEAVELQLVKYLIKPLQESAIKEALSLACMSLNNQQSNIYTIGTDSHFDTYNKILVVHNEIVKLTQFELLLLDTLVKRSPRTLTYDELQNIVWPDEGLNIDSLRTLVRSLRKKLQADVIENISGVGYRIIPSPRP